MPVLSKAGLQEMTPDVSINQVLWITRFMCFVKMQNNYSYLINLWIIRSVIKHNSHLPTHSLNQEFIVLFLWKYTHASLSIQ